MNEYLRARSYLGRLLSKRSYSCLEIEKKLKGKGYSEETVISILDYGKRMDYLDDKKLAEEVVDFRLRKGEGALKIIFELRKKGIENKIIEEVKNRITPDEEKRIMEEIFHKLNKEKKGHPQRIFNYFLRRGFAYQDIKEVLGGKLGREILDSVSSTE